MSEKVKSAQFFLRCPACGTTQHPLTMDGEFDLLRAALARLRAELTAANERAEELQRGHQLVLAANERDIARYLTEIRRLRGIIAEAALEADKLGGGA